MTDNNNIYKKKDVHPATRKQLDNPLYQNIILPKELDKQIKDSKEITVYFYSPTCHHCKETTPIVVPISKDMGVNLKQFNLLEFKDGWKEYDIVGTPTIIHFSNGKEKGRIMGIQSEEKFKKWFEKIG